MCAVIRWFGSPALAIALVLSCALAALSFAENGPPDTPKSGSKGSCCCQKEGAGGKGRCCCNKDGAKGKGQCCRQNADSSTEARGKGGPGWKGGRGREDHRADMQTFHYLLDHRREITRKVTNPKEGVETLTESDNRAVVGKIQEHAAAMARRLEEGRPIHMRDPLFREIFRHADQIQMRVENTPRGVKVRETSNDPHVVRLIQAHAQVVSGFLARGHEEVHKDHPVPPRPTSP